MDNPDVVQITIDLRAPSTEADCFDGLVAFHAATQKMRSSTDDSGIPESMIAHTRKAFAKLDAEHGDLRLLASGASDHLYRQIAQLTILDRYTRVYVAKVIRDFFEQLKMRAVPTYYILDNTLRQDRFLALIELFELAGVSVITPRLHGVDWHVLGSHIRSCLSAGSHVAYVEPDATVSHLDAAQRLATQFACVATFRNLAPEDPQLSVLTLLTASH